MGDLPALHEAFPDFEVGVPERLMGKPFLKECERIGVPGLP